VRKETFMLAPSLGMICGLDRFYRGRMILSFLRTSPTPVGLAALDSHEAYRN